MMAGIMDKLRTAARTRTRATLEPPEVAELERAGIVDVIASLADDERHAHELPDPFERNPSDGAPTTIYFVRDAAGHIKIGRTSDLAQRLRALAHAHACPLTFLASIEAAGWYERYLHGFYGRERLNGEWFRPSPRLLAFIASLKVA